MKNILSNKQFLLLGAICLLTFFCFSYSLHNQFTNWDDDYYVTNDPYIKALTPHNLDVIFTQDITHNNYHPLCMLSLAANYYFSGLNPKPYYLTNIIIHILNVILVFFLATALCRRLKVTENGALLIACITATLFGIHPMHVESVSWIAERKDVLYTFFYMAGLLAYLRYLSGNQQKWYWITFLLFVASCLSKPMAVVFPLSLLCVDFLLKRPLGKKLIIEKIVFFVASLFFGGLAFYTQNKTGAIADFGVLTLGERIMYASYGYVMYMAKIFNPTYLSTFYPYPYRYINGNLPFIYYAAPYIAVSVPAVFLYWAYKNGSLNFRVVGFGFGFFTANVLFVLQFISVGAAIMADRYSYVAYFGLFFLIAYFIHELVRKIPILKVPVTATLLVITGGLAFLCHDRTYAWHDSRSLLGDAIKKYPYRALLSYKWMGNYYAQNNQPDSAMQYYSVLIQLHAADANVYENAGRIYNQQGDTKDAMDAFDMAATLKANKHARPQTEIRNMQSPQNVPAQNAVPAKQLSPEVEKRVAEKGFEFLQHQQFDAALQQYDVLVQINPNNGFYYFYRGVALFSTGKMDKAITNWTTAMKFNVKDVQQSASYNLSVAYDSLNKDSLAVYYMDIALGLGYKANPDFVEKLKRKKKEQQ